MVQVDFHLLVLQSASGAPDFVAGRSKVRLALYSVNMTKISDEDINHCCVAAMTRAWVEFTRVQKTD